MSARLIFLAIATCAGPALAEDQPRNWMLTASGGVMARDDDSLHGVGSVAISRRLGKGYIRATVTRFDYSIRQVDVRLPSTYTLGYISAGTTFGHWFVDGYSMAGSQHYEGVVGDLGKRSISGSTHSGVYGAGADFGYVKWLGKTWSLTPSLALNFVYSRALREQIGPMGPSEFETTEEGVTGSASLRLDHRFGHAGRHDVDLYVARYQTSNQSAALTSGTRGALFPDQQSGKCGDGWTEIGGGVSLLVGKSNRLYLDVAALRTIGAQSGDVTTATSGFRFLF